MFLRKISGKKSITRSHEGLQHITNITVFQKKGLSPGLIGRARPRRAPVDLGATMEDTSHKDASSVENRIKGGGLCRCQGSRGGGTRRHRKCGDLSPLLPRMHRLVCL